MLGEWRDRTGKLVPTPSNVELGDYSYCFGECRGAANNVIIGKFCSIAVGVVFGAGFSHRTDFVSTFPFKQKLYGLDHLPSNIKEPKDIIIGNDVWIGENACIMEGCVIGDGAIIGYGAVVTKDVKPYSIVGGVPAKFIKWRFEIPQITALKRIAWYNWPIEKIRENTHLLQSDRIAEFIALHDR